MKNHKIVLTNGTLIDGTGRLPIHHATVEIVDGRIGTITQGADYHPVRKDEKVLNLYGHVILPGFIHSHAHTSFKHLNNKPLQGYHKEYLTACIKEGITTIRDMGITTNVSNDDVIEQTKALDDFSYPRVITSGKVFTAPGGYGGQEPIGVASDEEARSMVREVLDKGVHFITTALEDGSDPSTFGLPQLNPDLLNSICHEAHKRGAYVSSHVTNAKNLQILINAGINDAAHMIYDRLDDDLIRQLVNKGVRIVPTLTVLKMFQEKYGIPLLEQGIDNVKRFVKAGGEIGLGDDFIEAEEPWYRLGMPWEELKLLRDAGLTPMQIIVSATSIGAKICNMSDEIGTIETGKRADLFVIEGDPLLSMESLREVRYVIKDGTIVYDDSMRINGQS